MVQNTPYLVVRGGKQHIVEATNAAAAVTHVVRDLNVTVKAATGKEFSAFLAGGGKLETAGQNIETAGSTPADKIASDVLPIDYGVPSFPLEVGTRVHTPLTLDGVLRGWSITDGEEVWNVDLNGARVKHQADREALTSGHAEEISEEGPGKVAAKREAGHRKGATSE